MASIKPSYCSFCLEICGQLIHVCTTCIQGCLLIDIQHFPALVQSFTTFHHSSACRRICCLREPDQSKQCMSSLSSAKLALQGVLTKTKVGKLMHSCQHSSLHPLKCVCVCVCARARDIPKKPNPCKTLSVVRSNSCFCHVSLQAFGLTVTPSVQLLVDKMASEMKELLSAMENISDR